MYDITMRMSLSNNTAKHVFSVLLLLLISPLFCTVVHGQDMGGSGLTPHQERELAYADKLMNAGLADYSKDVLADLNLPPAIMDIRKVTTFCAVNDFDKAKAIIAKKGSDDSEGAWALRITLADGYFMWGKYSEAGAIYTKFFKKFPNGPKDKAFKGFYVSSAYKYAQMMLMMDKKKEAITAYKSALNAKPVRHIERQIMGELLEIIVQQADKATGATRDKLLKDAQVYIDKILWVQDLWFGRAIVALADIKRIKGDVDGAMKLIEDYTDQLKDIDENLKVSALKTGEDLTKLSPMAQCRYMIGSIMQDEADKLLKNGGDRQRAQELLMGKQIGKKSNGRPKYSSGALQHFLNVFIRYPNTSWAPDAGKRFRETKETLLSEWGKEVKAQVKPEQWKAVEVAQFKEARALFNQQRFKEAIEMYEQVLALFPDSETSVSAIAELASCYIEEKDFLLADVVVGHLAESFCQNKELMILAGDKVVGVAFKYSSIGNDERMRATYDIFFKYFKNHPRTSGEIYRFANEEYRDDNFDAALAYYEQIVEYHKDKPVYVDTMNKIAVIYNKQNDRINEIKTLKVLIKELKEKENPGHLLVSAMFRFAGALEALDPKYIPIAFSKYKELEKMLSDEKSRVAYQNTADEAKANSQILQASMLKHAMTDVMRKTVPADVQKYFDKKYKRKVPPELILKTYYKKGAIKILVSLVEKFPKSPYAPVALSQVGTLYTVLEKPDDARKVLQRLQKEYPESNEAKNAVFTIGTNLLELGMRNQAIKYFKEMFSGTGKYSSAQFLTVGKILFDTGEYKLSIVAFDKVIKSEKTRSYLEPARVRKGRALCELGEYVKAAELLRALLKDYPKSYYTLEICRSASQAFAAIASETSDDAKRFDLFNEAVLAMIRARKFSSDSGEQAELDVGMARIFERKAAAEDQFGDKEKAAQYRNDAIAAYQAVMMFRDPKDVKVAPHLQDAYFYCLPLMLKIERYDDVKHDADTYAKVFPKGKHIREIRRFLNKARIGLVTTEESTETDEDATTVEEPASETDATITTEE